MDCFIVECIKSPPCSQEYEDLAKDVARLEQTLRFSQADISAFKSALCEISCHNADSASLENLANKVEHLRGKEALPKDLQSIAKRDHGHSAAESRRLTKEKACIEMQLTSAGSETK